MAGNDGKKKMHPMAWVGIGCGAVVLVAVVAMALMVGWCNRKVEDFKDNPAKVAAEMVVKMNPDVELVSSDDEAGTITIRDKKTGKETTVNFEDAAEGRFTIEADGTTTTIDGKEGSLTSEGPDGKVSIHAGGLENLPKWFEIPEGVAQWSPMQHREKDGKVNGVIAGSSQRSREELSKDFQSNLEAAGFVEGSSSKGPGMEVLDFADEDKGRTIQVIIATMKEKTRVQLIYEEK